MSSIFVHAAFGLAVYVVARTYTGLHSLIYPFAYIFFAALPDIDVLVYRSHRTLTHSLLAASAASAASAAAWVLLGPVAGLCVLQYVFHIGLDMLSDGVALLYPWTPRVVGIKVRNEYGRIVFTQARGRDGRKFWEKSHSIDLGEAALALLLLVFSLLPWP